MTALFKKLNFKQQQSILVLNAPVEFKQELNLISPFTKVVSKTDKAKAIEFVLAFVLSEKDIADSIKQVQDKLHTDAVLWFAYPKGTSKKYKVDINRDNGWNALGKLGFEPVRVVAIDNDWSALRFRKVAFIKTMTRNQEMVLSAEGKTKVLERDKNVSRGTVTIKKKPESIDEYIASFPKQTQVVLQQVRNTIQKTAPKATEAISYGMPAFKQNGMLVYFAGYENHIGLYALPSGNNAFKKELSQYKTGKGSIQFPLDKTMPLELIKRIVKFRIEENELKQKQKK